MSDLLYILATVAFFAICVFYVKWCDKIVGSDELAERELLESIEPAASVATVVLHADSVDSTSAA
jgi:hypothetical protein